MTRRIRYALAGMLLGLGAPAGLLFVRLRRRRVSMLSVRREIEAQSETYLYSAASTTLAFVLFGGILGHQADRLARLATTDPLTGLFNPRAFHERMRHELVRAARYQEPLSLLIIDLDGLKRVNDHYGHEAGHIALRLVANAIRGELRETDLGARLGGDEFGVLAPRTNKESAIVFAERLRSRVARGVSGLAGRGATVSIGIASIVPSTDGISVPVSLIGAADEALYQVKREGGNRVTVGRRQPSD